MITIYFQYFYFDIVQSTFFFAQINRKSTEFNATSILSNVVCEARTSHFNNLQDFITFFIKIQTENLLKTLFTFGYNIRKNIIRLNYIEIR